MGSYSGMGIGYSSLIYSLWFSVRFSCSCFAPQSMQVLAGHREGKVLLLREGRESLFGGSALAGHVANEMKGVWISWIFTNQCTLSPLMTNGEQSDAVLCPMLCPNHVKVYLQPKKE